MAESNDSLFTVNAGQILAKLHLGALQPIPSEIILNTGIKNMAKSATPDNIPADLVFDLTNKSGLYELGVVRTVKKITNAEKAIADDTSLTGKKDEIEKKREELNKQNEDLLNKEKSAAYKTIKAYFAVFSGKDAASKIKENEVIATPISDSVKATDAFKEYKDFKIPALEEKEDKDFKKKNKDKKEWDRNFCFKVGFTVETETM